MEPNLVRQSTKEEEEEREEPDKIETNNPEVVPNSLPYNHSYHKREKQF